jgi:DNA-binding NarL/FixJ family response regulator
MPMSALAQSPVRLGQPWARLVLADDFLLFREGLARLAAEAGFAVVAQVADAAALMASVAAHLPDVAVVDIRMPPTNTTEGLVAATEIRRMHPRVGVLVLSHHVEVHHAAQLLSADGAGVGYLLKDRVNDLEAFATALRRVGDGERVIDPQVAACLLARPRARGPLDELTDREREVLRLMAEGRSNQGIRTQLGVSDRTVETHVRSILMKLDIQDTLDDHRRVLAVLSYLRG